MRNTFLLSAILVLFGALDMVPAHGDQPDIAAQSSPYKVASSLRPDAVGQVLDKSSIRAAAKGKRRRDCKTAPGLCTWWEKCCPVRDTDGIPVRYQCVDTHNRP